MSYSKQYITNFLRGTLSYVVNDKVIKSRDIDLSPYDNYTALNITPYSITTEYGAYPVVIVHNMPVANDIKIAIA